MNTEIKKLRPMEAGIESLIQQQRDVEFVLKTISNIEYYLFHIIPNNKLKLSSNMDNYRFLRTSFLSLAFDSYQKIIKGNITFSLIYNKLKFTYNQLNVHSVIVGNGKSNYLVRHKDSGSIYEYFNTTEQEMLDNVMLLDDGDIGNYNFYEHII